MLYYEIMLSQKGFSEIGSFSLDVKCPNCFAIFKISEENILLQAVHSKAKDHVCVSAVTNCVDCGYELDYYCCNNCTYKDYHLSKCPPRVIKRIKNGDIKEFYCHGHREKFEINDMFFLRDMGKYLNPMFHCIQCDEDVRI